MGLLRQLGIGRKEIGRLDVPGQATVSLPSGKVALRWEEDRQGRDQRSSSVRAPRDLQVSVTPAAGGSQLEVSPATGGSSGAGGGRIYAPYGSFEVMAPGEYLVSARTGETRAGATLIIRA